MVVVVLLKSFFFNLCASTWDGNYIEMIIITVFQNTLLLSTKLLLALIKILYKTYDMKKLILPATEILETDIFVTLCSLSYWYYLSLDNSSLH